MNTNGENIAGNRLGFPVRVIHLTLFISFAPFLLSLPGVDLGSPESGLGLSRGLNQAFPKGSVIPVFLEWSALCCAAFTTLLAYIFFKITNDLKILAIGTVILLSGCSDVFLSLAPRLSIAGNGAPDNTVSFVWAVARISGLSIFMAGIGLLIIWGASMMRRVLIGIILAGLIIPVMSYGVIHYFINENLNSLRLLNESLIVPPWDAAAFAFYGFAGLLVFPIFHKKEQNYISHALLIFLIPLVAAHLYMTLGSKVLLDHGLIPTYFLKFAASLILLSAFVMELLKGFKEKRVIAGSNELAQNEMNILESRKKLGPVSASSMGDAIFGIDNKGITTSINTSAQLILGFSENEFLGKPIYEVVDYSQPEGQSHLKGKHPILLSMESGQILEEDRGTFWRKDGTSFRAEYVCTPIQGEKRALGAIIAFTEIVERTIEGSYFYEALQEASKAREEAEQANQSKSYFLSIMSHEIRTPLSVILGYAEILQRTPSLDSEHKEFVSRIETSGNHLLELINDILDISKIEAGEIVLNPTDFNLNDLVNGLAMMFRNRCEAKDLEFSLEGIDSEPLYVNGDEGKLRQILVNLLGNAVKFTNNGKIVLIVEKKPAHIYKFSVIDTGNGVPPEDQDKIFEPFKQGKDGLNIGGTGLGLPISWELAELMGGTISVDSEVGKGSAFTLILELKPAQEAVVLRSNRSRRVKSLSGKTHLKALVVDDAQENRIMLCRILESIGISVKEADNGDKAIEKIREFNPDIIFMDKRMPVMNGDEATRKIFEEHGPDRFKIVGVTASAFSHEREAMLAAGCAVVIGKPFRIEQIFSCIQTLLEVEYEYQNERKNRKENLIEDQAVSTEFSSIQIPVKMFLDFKESIDKEDSSGLIQQLAQLSTLGEKGTLLKTRLSTMIEEDDFEGIMDLLETIPVVGTMHD